MCVVISCICRLMRMNHRLHAHIHKGMAEQSCPWRKNICSYNGSRPTSDHGWTFIETTLWSYVVQRSPQRTPARTENEDRLQMSRVGPVTGGNKMLNLNIQESAFHRPNIIHKWYLIDVSPGGTVAPWRGETNESCVNLATALVLGEMACYG